VDETTAPHSKSKLELIFSENLPDPKVTPTGKFESAQSKICDALDGFLLNNWRQVALNFFDYLDEHSSGSIHFLVATQTGVEFCKLYSDIDPDDSENYKEPEFSRLCFQVNNSINRFGMNQKMVETMYKFFIIGTWPLDIVSEISWPEVVVMFKNSKDFDIR
jgi:hypothetical protein